MLALIFDCGLEIVKFNQFPVTVLNCNKYNIPSCVPTPLLGVKGWAGFFVAVQKLDDSHEEFPQDRSRIKGE